MRSVQERPLLPQSRPQTVPGLFSWAGEMARQLTALFQEYGFRVNRTLPKDGSEAMQNPMRLVTVTVATLPTASQWTGAVVYVSDGAAGAKFRGSDGTSWVNLG